MVRSVAKMHEILKSDSKLVKKTFTGSRKSQLMSALQSQLIPWAKSVHPHANDLMHQYDHRASDAKIKQIRFVPANWPHTANICVKLSSQEYAKAFESLVTQTDESMNALPSTGPLECINEFIYFVSPNYYPMTLEKLSGFLSIVCQFEPSFKESMFSDLERVLENHDFVKPPEEKLSVQFKNLTLFSEEPLVKKIENMNLDDTSIDDELSEKFTLRLRFGK